MRPLVAHCHLGLGKLYLRTGIANLDFHTAPGYEMMWVAMNVGCGLVNITPDGKFVGDLAESQQISSDTLNYTFKLRNMPLKVPYIAPAQAPERSRETWIKCPEKARSRSGQALVASWSCTDARPGLVSHRNNRI